MSIAESHRFYSLDGQPLTVNVVAPGAIETDFGGALMRNSPQMKDGIRSITALGRTGVAEDIGPMIASLLSPDNRWVNAGETQTEGVEVSVEADLSKHGLPRLIGIGAHSAFGDGQHVLVGKAGIEQFAHDKADPTGSVEVVHIARAVGIDPREQRHDRGQLVQILPVELDAGGAGHGGPQRGIGGGPAQREVDHLGPCGNCPVDAQGNRRIGQLAAVLGIGRVIVGAGSGTVGAEHRDGRLESHADHAQVVTRGSGHQSHIGAVIAVGVINPAAAGHVGRSGRDPAGKFRTVAVDPGIDNADCHPGTAIAGSPGGQRAMLLRAG